MFYMMKNVHKSTNISQLTLPFLQSQKEFKKGIKKSLSSDVGRTL